MGQHAGHLCQHLRRDATELFGKDCVLDVLVGSMSGSCAGFVLASVIIVVFVLIVRSSLPAMLS
jgi:tetrahydromethanopterin S-methyltransferase subunit F